MRTKARDGLRHKNGGEVGTGSGMRTEARDDTRARRLRHEGIEKWLQAQARERTRREWTGGAEQGVP